MGRRVLELPETEELIEDMYVIVDNDEGTYKAKIDLFKPTADGGSTIKVTTDANAVTVNSNSTATIESTEVN